MNYQNPTGNVSNLQLVRIAGSHPAGLGSIPGNRMSFGKPGGKGALDFISVIACICSCCLVEYTLKPSHAISPLKFMSEEGFEPSPTEVDCDLNAAP
jgi:hypothetical protein